jgi:hypothetical protein
MRADSNSGSSLGGSGNSRTSRKLFLPHLPAGSMRVHFDKIFWFFLVESHLAIF